MFFAFCACLLLADDLPKVEVEGFEVSVESARRLGGAVLGGGAGGQMHSIQLALKIEPKDAGDARKAVATSKVVVAPDLPGARWNVSTFPSSLVQRVTAGGILESSTRGNSTRISGSWRSDDKAPEKLDSLEGELAIVETTSQSYSFSGGELVAGATQKQGDVDIRLYCCDLDPDDETLQVGVRLKGPNQGPTLLRSGARDADALALSSLQREAGSPVFELECDDGSRVKGNSQSRASGPNFSRYATQFAVKGKKPKALHLMMRSIVGEPRRVPFKLENIPITEGPTALRGLTAPAVVLP